MTNTDYDIDMYELMSKQYMELQKSGYREGDGSWVVVMKPECAVDLAICERYYGLRQRWFIRHYGVRRGIRWYRRWVRRDYPRNIGRWPDGSYNEMEALMEGHWRLQ